MARLTAKHRSRLYFSVYLMAFVLLAPFLIGCESWKNLNGLSDTVYKPPTSASPSAALLHVVGAGQSNMAFEHLADTFQDALNVASPGTTIAQWQRGQPLYAAMLAAVRSKPSVVLFWQGEAEGLGFDVNLSPDNDWPNWGTKFSQMIHDLRADAGYAVPVVLVQIGQVNTAVYPSPHWSDVQGQQASIRLPRVIMVSAADLKPDGDAVHYSQAQYHIMQQRMLSAANDLRGRTPLGFSNR